MQIEVNKTDDGVILSLIGIIKKTDAMDLAEEINKIARQKPSKLALDCTQLATLSIDSAPFIISALERGRFGKNNVQAFGCNQNVERTLRGSGFERVGKFD